MEYKTPLADQRKEEFPYPLHSSATSVAAHFENTVKMDCIQKKATWMMKKFWKTSLQKDY